MKTTINPYYLFWFCVGVFLLSFGAMMCLLFMEIPDQNREMASNTQGFLQGSLIMSTIGFLLTGNILQNKSKQPDTGTTTAEITATITQEPVKDETNNT